ncbi:MAG: DUF916 and DUF3324 domain-containing protein [Vagococcus sp.]
MKKNKIYYFILSIGLLMVMFTANSRVSYADDTQTNFAYKVEFPDNQIEKDKGYLHLKMNPGQEQKVSIEFSNAGKQKTAVGISLNGAKTNSNGVVEYGDTKVRNDESLKFDFKKIVTAPKRVELKPGEVKKVEFDIKMPDTQYDGVIAGGIQIIEENQNNSEENKGSTVINEYAYVIAMLLQETDAKVLPQLKLNTVKAGQSNFRNTVFVNYSNTHAAYVNDMTTEVQITKKGSGTVIYERKQAKMRMAPNSFIEFPVSMSGEQMVAGDYTAKILVTASDDVREEWTKDFKITKDDADKFNERDVGLVQNKGLNWKLIILVVVGFFALVILITTLVVLTRKKKTGKSKKKSKKGKSKKK